mgnify:CR=1 FL=1
MKNYKAKDYIKISQNEMPYNFLLSDIIKMDAKNIVNMFSSNSEFHENEEIISTFTWTEGYEINTKGELIANKNAIITDYIDVKNNTNVIRNAKSAFTGGTRTVFYDKDKNYINGISKGFQIYDYELDMPDNTKFIRFDALKTYQNEEQITLYNKNISILNELYKIQSANITNTGLSNILDYVVKNLSINYANNLLSISGKNTISESVQISTSDNDSISFPEPLNGDVPLIYIEGILPTTKDVTNNITLRYVSKTHNFSCYATVSCQGNSTMNYDKKNFTIKLYNNTNKTKKFNVNFKNWGKHNKFVLKADWQDRSHSRNDVSAKIWGNIVSSRKNIPLELETTPNFGAVDGFPVLTYVNGNCVGIYDWNIPKDTWMLNIDTNNSKHAVLCAEINNSNNPGGLSNKPSCQFRELADIDGSDWSLEMPDKLNGEIKTSFNNLITCVKDTDDDTFKTTIGNYLDTESMIDYYLFSYFVGHVDGLAKNMLMYTYDGIKWYCGAYDMDTTFTLTTQACPENYFENYSLLWQRVETNFSEELKIRYTELRKTALNVDYIKDLFSLFFNPISDLIAKDVEAYPNIPNTDTTPLQTIYNKLTTRAQYVDTEIENL